MECLMASKTQIDKAGRILSDASREYDETSLEMDYIFDEYRKNHLEPLTKLTLTLQQWLQTYHKEYYIAQRLKRKPQILRKLKRFSVRLTQLQDIGGCRIIVDKNSDVDELISFIREKIHSSTLYQELREVDYREFGRDDTGYRAHHMVIKMDSYWCELQIRSNIQHYWAESIERTSVMYGHRLKEKEGDIEVISYFKFFSDCLYDIETTKNLDRDKEFRLQTMRNVAEKIVNKEKDGIDIGGRVNQDIVKTMMQKEGAKNIELNNWILVFDWSDGNFVTWDVVSRDADGAVSAYIKYEKQFPEEENYEVVLIGTSDVSTLLKTHSHYFGIDHHNSALEGMEESIIGLGKRSELDIGARRILMTLKRRKYIGTNTISIATLKNHFCQNVATFDSSLEVAIGTGFIRGIDPISLEASRIHELTDFV